MDPELREAGRSDVEERFLTRLERVSPGLGDVYLWPGFPLITTWCVWEPSSPLLRTLRVDFDGARLRGGNDPNHHMDLDLDQSDPDYFEVVAGESPEWAAATAAKWFQRQLDRAIDRHEWDGTRYQQWVLTDTQKVLCSRIAGGPGWQPGGAWDSSHPHPDRSPDLVVRVWPGVTPTP